MTRHVIRRIRNFIYMPILRQLGFHKQKPQKDLPLQSHFYVNTNETDALLSICKGYLKTSGWIESRNSSISRDEHEVIPWLTYPCIYFLRQLNLKDRKVLEFGAGASTLWFSKWCKSIVSYESDKEYLDLLEQRLSGKVNVTLNYYPIKNEGNYDLLNLQKAFEIESALGDHNDFLAKIDLEKLTIEITQLLKEIDILLIDGGPRYLITQLCLQSIEPETLIIVDNTDRNYEQNIERLMIDSGYLEIPFHGLSPLNAYTSTTSVFLRPEATVKWMSRR